MLRWLAAFCLSSTVAGAQGLPSYPGDAPGRAQAASCEVKPLTFAGYGDSLWAGACSATGPTAKLQALLGGGWVGSTDAGDGGPPAVGGYTAAEIRARFEATRDTACTGSTRCSVYVVQGGVNSIIGGLTAAATLTDMVAIVDNLLALSSRPKVVWVGLLPFRGSPQGSDARTLAVLAYNALMAVECAARPAVQCVFPYSALEDPANPGYLLPAYTCDEIHLLQAGTDIMAGMTKTSVSYLTAGFCR